MAAEVEPSAQVRPSFLEHVKKYAVRYFAAIGIGMGCASGMDGVIKVSTWVSYATKNYRALLLQVYDWLGSLIQIRLPTFICDMLVMLGFYLTAMAYGIRRGTPVDVPLQTLPQKLTFLARRVPLAVAMATTCFLFSGASTSDALSLGLLFIPCSAALYGVIAWRMTQARYQLEHEYFRFLTAIWLLIATLAVLSHTEIFEYLAGEPPVDPPLRPDGPFGI